jgi:two-component system chemotaxis sensor kinase CheA
MQVDVYAERPQTEAPVHLMPLANNSDAMEDRRFYSPQATLASLNGQGNPNIYRCMETIRPVSITSDMMRVMEVFRKNQQEHFFPVLTEEGQILGLICERDLKEYVYSRYGFCLLAKANRDQPELLLQFLTSCPSADIDSSTDHLLTVYHEHQGSREGVLITHQGRYLGFLRLAALMQLAHERQMQLNAEHHQELARKHREIQVVLQNMRQGICTVLPGLHLHHEYSSHLAQTLEQDNIGGCSVIDLLFRENVSADQCQIIETALSAILEEDELMYECNSESLPREVEFRVGERVKFLELHWSPVIDDNECVQRLLLVVRDVTKMRDLQQQALQHARELTMLGEILAVTPQRFEQFVTGSLAMLSENRH